jgi:PTH1 family peptidyl-tRNA hydrolase
MVIVDDLDLPPGSVRMRAKGSHGGHNGLRSIIDELGTPDFARIRVGIGRPTAGGDPADFVLERPTGDDRRLLDDAVARAAEGVSLWVTKGADAAMRHANAKPARSTRPPARERNEPGAGRTV